MAVFVYPLAINQIFNSLNEDKEKYSDNINDPQRPDHR
jgi:hypothetical protein